MKRYNDYKVVLTSDEITFCDTHGFIPKSVYDRLPDWLRYGCGYRNAWYASRSGMVIFEYSDDDYD